MTELRDLLHDAASLADDPPDRPAAVWRRAVRLRARRRRAWAAGGAAAAAAVVAGGIVLADGPGPGGGVTTTPSPTVSPSPQPSGTSATSLDERYDRCVKAKGFDPGGVQVIVWGQIDATPPPSPRPADGTPYWVKTGRDVPSAIHRPCLVAIGGADPHMSSYGNP